MDRYWGGCGGVKGGLWYRSQIENNNMIEDSKRTMKMPKKREGGNVKNREIGSGMAPPL
jgi:hypothetical protein